MLMYELVSALRDCERLMDTAALNGVHDILPPVYADSWADAHERARAVLAAVDAAGHGALQKEVPAPDHGTSVR